MYFLYKAMSNTSIQNRFVARIKFELLAEISELIKENANVKAENTKLKQEIEARIMG